MFSLLHIGRLLLNRLSQLLVLFNQHLNHEALPRVEVKVYGLLHLEAGPQHFRLQMKYQTKRMSLELLDVIIVEQHEWPCLFEISVDGDGTVPDTQLELDACDLRGCQ
jgi:hypothetical protein